MPVYTSPPYRSISVWCNFIWFNTILFIIPFCLYNIRMACLKTVVFRDDPLSSTIGTNVEETSLSIYFNLILNLASI